MDLPVEVDLRYGNPSEQLLKAITQKELDFLVLGSHCHGPFAELVLRDSVPNVRNRASVPLMLVSGDTET